MKSLRRLINSRASNSKNVDTIAEKDPQDVGEAKSSGTKGIGDFDDGTTGNQNVVCKSYECLDAETLTNKMNTKDVLSFDPKLVANDLVIADWNMYKQLTLEEVRAFENEERFIINQMLRNYEKVYQWATNAVVECKDTKIQKKTITFFLKIAQVLVCNNDFHSSHAIISALQSPTISILEEAWNKLTSNKRKMFEDLTAIFSNEGNYFKLTEKMCEANEVNNICIPYLALFLIDFNEKVPLDRDDKLNTFRRVGVIVDDLGKLIEFRLENGRTIFESRRDKISMVIKA